MVNIICETLAELGEDCSCHGSKNKATQEKYGKLGRGKQIVNSAYRYHL